MPPTAWSYPENAEGNSGCGSSGRKATGSSVANVAWELDSQASDDAGSAADSSTGFGSTSVSGAGGSAVGATGYGSASTRTDSRSAIPERTSDSR